MDEERVFSLSYEQLTRFAEKRIREICPQTALLPLICRWI